MLLIDNIGQLLSLDGQDLGLIKNAAILIEGTQIFWCGPKEKLPAVAINGVIDAQNKLVVPGLIDCHSHLIFAGNRSLEFQWRMAGETYQSIMARGGGIMSTVNQTRSASDEELLRLASTRADAMLEKGVTTLEAKSGYGLSFEHELRSLRLLKKLNESHQIDIHASFLGAHVIPAEFKTSPEAYVAALVNEMLPAIAAEKLALDCDVFCETGAFSLIQTRKILAKAHELGLGLRVHLEQLSHQGTTILLDEFPIKSISHGDFLSEGDTKKIAAHGCVVEILPIAALFLRAKTLPPVAAMMREGVKVAIATDFNPGSAMCDDLVLAARLGVTLMGVSIAEAIKSITINAAIALGRNDIGLIRPGNKADILLTNCDDMSELFYDWTKHPARLIIKNGQPVRKVHEESICSPATP